MATFYSLFLPESRHFRNHFLFKNLLSDHLDLDIALAGRDWYNFVAFLNLFLAYLLSLYYMQGAGLSLEIYGSMIQFLYFESL